MPFLIPGGFAALSIGKKLAIGAGVLIALVLAAWLLVRAVSARDERLKQAGRDEVQAAWNGERAGRAQARAEFQGAITASLQPQFDRLATALGTIDTSAAEINVRLPAAVAAEPRYRDPDCALTQPVLEQVNAARALTAQPLQEPAR